MPAGRPNLAGKVTRAVVVWREIFFPRVECLIFLTIHMISFILLRNLIGSLISWRLISLEVMKLMTNVNFILQDMISYLNLIYTNNLIVFKLNPDITVIPSTRKKIKGNTANSCDVIQGHHEIISSKCCQL